MESHEPTRQRVEPSLPTFHEDHFAGKGFNSMSHYNLVHNFIPVPHVAKILDATAASGEGIEQARNNFSVAGEQGQEQNGGHPRGTERQNESPLCYIWWTYVISRIRMSLHDYQTVMDKQLTQYLHALR